MSIIKNWKLLNTLTQTNVYSYFGPHLPTKRTQSKTNINLNSKTFSSIVTSLAYKNFFLFEKTNKLMTWGL